MDTYNFIPVILTTLITMIVAVKAYFIYYGPFLCEWLDTHRGLKEDKEVNAAVSAKVRNILNGENLVILRNKLLFYEEKGEDEDDYRMQYYVQTDNGRFSFIMANDLPRVEDYRREGRARIILISDENDELRCVNNEYIVTLDNKTFNILNKTALRMYRENERVKKEEKQTQEKARKNNLISSLKIS